MTALTKLPASGHSSQDGIISEKPGHWLWASDFPERLRGRLPEGEHPRLRQSPTDPQKWRQPSRGPGIPPQTESPLTTCSAIDRQGGRRLGLSSGGSELWGRPSSADGAPRARSPLQSHCHPGGGLVAAPLPRPSADRPCDALDLVPGSLRVRLDHPEG